MNLPSTIEIPKNLIDDLKNEFYNRESFVTNDMEKISSIKELATVQNLVKYLQLDIQFLVGDNFYKHDRAYFPHVDAPLQNAKKYLHVVVPIEKNYLDDQYFIIFDQTSLIGPATWTGLLDVDINFMHNKQVKGYIKKEDITHYVENAIDDTFYKKYLPYPKEWYNGLSGTAVKWEPGIAIVFPSNRLHCTGKMPDNVKKLGLTLKFLMPDDVYR